MLRLAVMSRAWVGGLPIATLKLPPFQNRPAVPSCCTHASLQRPVQAALKEAGDKVPEHLQVELPPGAQAAQQATGSAALATVLERSRK